MGAFPSGSQENRAKRALQGARWECPHIVSLIRQSRRFYITYHKINIIGPFYYELCLFYDFSAWTLQVYTNMGVFLPIFHRNIFQNTCLRTKTKITVLGPFWTFLDLFFLYFLNPFFDRFGSFFRPFFYSLARRVYFSRRHLVRFIEQ